MREDLNPSVRKAVIENGREEDLDYFSENGTADDRATLLLTHKRDSDLDKAMDDSFYTNWDMYILDSELKDDDFTVLMAVAEVGRPQDLDTLRACQDRNVRSCVASYSRRPQDLAILKNDPEGVVQYYAKKTLEENKGLKEAVDNISKKAFASSLFAESSRSEGNGTRWDRCKRELAEDMYYSLANKGIQAYEIIPCRDERAFDADGEEMAVSKWVPDEKSDMVAIRHNGSNREFHISLVEVKLIKSAKEFVATANENNKNSVEKEDIDR